MSNPSAGLENLLARLNPGSLMHFLFYQQQVIVEGSFLSCDSPEFLPKALLPSQDVLLNSLVTEIPAGNWNYLVWLFLLKVMACIALLISNVIRLGSD